MKTLDQSINESIVIFTPTVMGIQYSCHILTSMLFINNHVDYMLPDWLYKIVPLSCSNGEP